MIKSISTGLLLVLLGMLGLLPAIANYASDEHSALTKASYGYVLTGQQTNYL